MAVIPRSGRCRLGGRHRHRRRQTGGGLRPLHAKANHAKSLPETQAKPFESARPHRESRWSRSCRSVISKEAFTICQWAMCGISRRRTPSAALSQRAASFAAVCRWGCQISPLSPDTQKLFVQPGVCTLTAPLLDRSAKRRRAARGQRAVQRCKASLAAKRVKSPWQRSGKKSHRMSVRWLFCRMVYLKSFSLLKISVAMMLNSAVMPMMMPNAAGLWAKGIPAVFTFMP